MHVATQPKELSSLHLRDAGADLWLQNASVGIISRAFVLRGFSVFQFSEAFDGEDKVCSEVFIPNTRLLVAKATLPVGRKKGHCDMIVQEA